MQTRSPDPDVGFGLLPRLKSWFFSDSCTVTHIVYLNNLFTKYLLYFSLSPISQFYNSTTLNKL